MTAKARRRPQQADEIPPAGAVKYGYLQDCVAFHLRIAQDLSFRGFAARAGSHTIHPGWFALLMLIGENPGIAATALSIASGRDKSTLTPAIRALLERGYVTRSQVSSDKRSFTLRLTEAGEAELARLKAHAEAHDQLIDDILGPADKANMVRLLRKIEDSLERPRLVKSPTD